jgi:FkbM family methyltransferase
VVPPSELLKNLREVILYGAGNVGRDVHAILSRHGVSVECFLDRNARPGTRYSGVPVHTPEEGPRNSGLPVVISIFNRDVDVQEISGVLQALGYGPVISFVDLHAAYSEEMGDRFWLTDRDTYRLNEASIARASEVWADEASRVLFDGLIAFRTSGDYRRLAKPHRGETQYLPSDVSGWPAGRQPLRLVDCGAYDGDTIAAFERAGPALEAVAAFEPDLASFAKLAAWARSRPSTPPIDLILWPCGVGARTGTVPFRSGLGESSRVGAAGDDPALFVALDDVLAGFRPNLVKLDIEGSEPEALRGAARLIDRYRPRLAVCVYHRPEHLWEVPLLLRSWDLGYRFHLRLHGFDGFDLVLYAVPG